MAATGNELITAQDSGNLRSLRSAAVRIFQGTMVFVASGYLTNVIAAGVNTFAGIAIAECDNSGGSAGDKSGEFYTTGAYELNGTGFTQADVGKLVYAVDDNVVSLTSTDQTLIGRITEFVSATAVMVEIDSVLAAS